MSGDQGPDGKQGRGKGGNYEVGYRKPPKQHQFKKGASGNPRGRPKSNKDRNQEMNFYADLNRILKRKVKVRHGTKTKRMSYLEALMTQMLQDAMSGDRRVRSELLKLADKSTLAAMKSCDGEPEEIIIRGGLPD